MSRRAPPRRPRSDPVDPKTYCTEAIAELRAPGGAPPARFGGRDRFRLIAVLAHFALRAPAPAAFTDGLDRLAADAERRGQPGLARAARAVLRDWRQRQREPVAGNSDTV